MNVTMYNDKGWRYQQDYLVLTINKGKAIVHWGEVLWCLVFGCGVWF